MILPQMYCMTAALVMPVTPGLRPSPAPSPPPALIVVLTVDQMRGDYLTRWEGQWSGGFRRLLDHGAVFVHGLQDHAVTETAPGHSTILSGREPAHTGIVLNELGVSDTAVSILGFPRAQGASPWRFVGTTLVDWLAGSDSGFRFLSVSKKDRAAILPIGRSRGPVYWFIGDRFTTSTWYADTLPAWVSAWNARRGADRLAGANWTLLLPDSAYPERDDRPWETGGRDVTFPHPLPLDSMAALRDLPDRPWMDSLTLDFALDGVRALGLGRRPRPDLLAVGLSATDYIGHRWGPGSRELHDQLLRLDRYLGPFLDSLSTLVQGRGIVVVLTADHGVTPYPEAARAEGRDAGRLALGAFVRTVNRTLPQEAALSAGPGLIYGDTARLRAVGVSPESLATTLMLRLRRVPGVVDAWTPATLGAPLRSNVGAVRWRRSLPTGFSWLVCAVAAPGYIWADDTTSTTHGTSNADDVGVPIVFMGPGIRPGIYPDTVRTVDIAPTLARLLDLKPAEKLDGRRVRRALR
jgi:predicted AlkP superfamily pyrophosphatase or phosphodiesterase